MIDKFACVILNYNDSKTTLDIINRIKDYNNLGHIVIVDNCSTDNSYEILKQKQDSKIVVIKTLKNGGYGAGNNFGINYATKVLKYRFVLISNPDVYFEDSVLEKMLCVLEKNDKCALVAPVQLDSNRRIIKEYAWRIPSIFQYIVTSGLIINKISNTYCYNQKYIVDKKNKIVDCVPGAFLGIDTSKFEDEYYDEDFFLYCEELVIGIKIKNNGFKSYLLVNDRYVHMHGVSINKSISSIYGQRKILTRSKLLFLKKYLNANKYEVILGKLFFMISDFESCINERRKKLKLFVHENE